MSFPREKLSKDKRTSSLFALPKFIRKNSRNEEDQEAPPDLNQSTSSTDYAKSGQDPETRKQHRSSGQSKGESNSFLIGLLSGHKGTKHNSRELKKDFKRKEEEDSSASSLSSSSASDLVRRRSVSIEDGPVSMQSSQMGNMAMSSSIHESAPVPSLHQLPTSAFKLFPDGPATPLSANNNSHNHNHSHSAPHQRPRFGTLQIRERTRPQLHRTPSNDVHGQPDSLLLHSASGFTPSRSTPLLPAAALQPKQPSTPRGTVSPKSASYDPRKKGHTRMHSIANVDHKGLRNSLDDNWGEEEEPIVQRPTPQAKPMYLRTKPKNLDTPNRLSFTPEKGLTTAQGGSQPESKLKFAPEYVKKIIVGQRAIRGFLARRQLQDRKRKAATRKHIIQEIVATEQSYYSGLSIITEQIMKPLRKEQIISEKDMRIIFSESLTIVGISRQLVTDLNKRTSHGITPSLQIGDLFLGMAILLKSYAGYVSNYNLAQHTVKELEAQNEQFATFLNKVFRSLPEKFKYETLPTMLIRPVQQIPRYRLLLEDLIKNTWNDHIDIKALRRSANAIAEIAQMVNEAKRESEQAFAVFTLQQEILDLDGDLVQSHRKLVKQGTLDAGKDKQIHLVLFNDILVFCKVVMHHQKERYKFLARRPLFLIKIEDSPSTNSFVIMSKEIKFKFTFQKQEERQQWVTTITRIIEESMVMEALNWNLHRPSDHSELSSRKQSFLGNIFFH